MAFSEITGSETVTTTEWSLVTDTSYAVGDASTTEGVYELWLEIASIAAGDQFTIKAYEKVQSGSTQREVDAWMINGPPSAASIRTCAFHFKHGWDFTIIKNAGTDRVVTWSIRGVV